MSQTGAVATSGGAKGLHAPNLQGSGGACLVCREPGAAGGLCPACTASPAGRAAPRLLFLTGPASIHVQRARMADLEQALSDPIARTDLAAAVRGHRAVLRAPAAVAERATRALDAYGLSALVVTVPGAAAQIPTLFAILVGLGLVVGMIAGALGSPLMGTLSPIVALLLLLAAFERVRTPLLQVRAASSSLPAHAEDAAVAALAGLEFDTAAQPLADVLRMARLLAAHEGLDSMDPGAANLGTVVASAAEVGSEIDRLDQTLDLLSGPHAPALDEAAVQEAACRTERTRDLLVQGLRSALAALGRAQAELSDGSEAASVIAQAAAELETSAREHAAAMSDVEALLSGN